jgi:hypothetical protein
MIGRLGRLTLRSVEHSQKAHSYNFDDGFHVWFEFEFSRHWKGLGFPSKSHWLAAVLIIRVEENYASLAKIRRNR